MLEFATVTMKTEVDQNLEQKTWVALFMLLPSLGTRLSLDSRLHEAPHAQNQQYL